MKTVKKGLFRGRKNRLSEKGSFFHAFFLRGLI
jgi:hypothetical protein